MTPEELFWSRLDRHPTGCWEYMGAKDTHGYGWLTAFGRQWKASRFCWFLLTGEIPERPFMVLHTCDNPPCARPSHLYKGTQMENARDRREHGREPDRAGIKNGHAKLSFEAIKAIRASAELQAVVAERYGITQGYVSQVRLGKFRVSC